MNVLVFNVSSASLKFQVIAMPLDAAFPEQGRAVVSGAVEEFGAEDSLRSKTRKSHTRNRSRPAITGY
jgi:acetate kinase